MDLAELDRWLADRHLTGRWSARREEEGFNPFLWRWADIHHGLMMATELVPMSRVPMRTIQPQNPSLKRGLSGMSNTLNFTVQCLMPGEIAPAQRHNTAEIRFVVKAAPGSAFIIEGEPFPMADGDVITTPNWCWHDHQNGSTQPAVWLDGRDMRLVGIGKLLYESYPQPRQPLKRPEGYSAKLFGKAKPSWGKTELPVPPYRYRWEDTYRTLTALKQSDGSRCDGVHVRCARPQHGGPTLPTMSCEFSLLRPREETGSHRHNGTVVYHVFRGEGATAVGEERLEWVEGDIFVIPPWEWHRHENRRDQDSILFSIADWPALDALGLYREEHKSGEQ